MKILLINKFLHPNGGSETYVFQLGKCLQERGHQVEYFGMEHENRIVGNRIHAYVRKRDYHGNGIAEKLRSACNCIYSVEARRKLRLVLEDFQPDVCHLNNFHYQLTPSILLEIRQWSRKTGRNCSILYTAHDSQLVCPNHLMRNPVTGENCRQCLKGSFLPCVKGKCIHGSRLRSLLGALDGWYWNHRRIYEMLDVVIAPSRFLARQLSVNDQIRDKIVVMPNFIRQPEVQIAEEKEPYVLYFGRYSKEKGIETLLQAVDALPQIPLVFAGDGPLKPEIGKRQNVTDKGFLSEQELSDTIRKARFTVVPSECFENCPFSVLESQLLGTPVLGAEIGGIPELIRPGETGELFESGNPDQLTRRIRELWQDTPRLQRYGETCKNTVFPTPRQYCEMLEAYYQ